MVLALGYVLLFGAVAPSIVPFCMVVFFVQIVTSSYLLLAYTQRSLPRTSDGIGAWREIVLLLNMSGVLFASYVFAAESDMLRNTPVITKLSAFIVYSALIRLGYTV